MERIFISDVDNKQSVCFNTGLDPRSFARTKMSQSLIETGFVVYPNGTNKSWKPAGVYESNGIMQVWGPLFNGKRLDLLINEISSISQNNTSQVALQAVVLWIRAKMSLGETHSSVNPGASFICFENGNENYPKGSVFFAPEYISNRCLFTEGSQLDRSNCPDLLGMEATAFCTGVMLYTILTGTHPYPTDDIYQDMREGVFLPINLAVPTLNEKLSGLIQAALLLPVLSKRTSMSAIDIVTEILKILINSESRITSISSLYRTLTTDKTKRFEKEKKQFLFKQNLMVKSRRFLARNKAVVAVCTAIAVFAGIITFTMTAGASQRPTTQGMTPENVIYAYYNAFSGLDHIYMEAIINGADKTDINSAVSYMAILKTMQSYERSSELRVRQAQAWLDNGGELPAPDVFGVTNLTLEHMAGREVEASLMVYRTEYSLWPLNEQYSLHRSDVISLRPDRKNNWRITEILRIEK